MIKFTFNTLAVLCLCVSSMQAQNSGCDGTRYKADVFSSFKKTTVVYAPTVGHTGGNINLSMDVYEPVGDVVAERPVVILAHGGSFIFGDRSNMAKHCELLAKKGYVAATITYRLYPFLVLGYPDSMAIFDTAVKAVGDMRAAVRYFREDAATGNQFHADADHIFIGGYSAGAVTALHCAYLDMGDDIPAFLQTLITNNGGLDGISGTASNKTYSSATNATVSMSGGLYRNGWIDAIEVPLVSIHGTADGTVPYVSGLAANIAYLEGSSLLHARANDIGLWNSLHTVPGGGHTNIYDNASYQPHMDTFWVNVTTMLEDITCTSVGTESPAAWENNWFVSPNPNAGQQFTLHLPNEVPVADVQLLNLTGQLVYQQNGVNALGQVRLPALPKGMYLIQLTVPGNPGKRFVAKKFVIE
jgi:poly(3-hydroxybutyrate) depolymerase